MGLYNDNDPPKVLRRLVRRRFALVYIPVFFLKPPLENTHHAREFVVFNEMFILIKFGFGLFEILCTHKDPQGPSNEGV